MKLVSLILTICFSTAAFATTAKITVPAKVNKHHVFFAASSATFQKQKSGQNLYALNVVLKLGTSFYQKGQLTYACDQASSACTIESYKAQAIFESCKVSQAKVSCKNRIAYDEEGSVEETTPSFGEDEKGRHHLDLESSVDGDRSRTDEGEFSDLF